MFKTLLRVDVKDFYVDNIYIVRTLESLISVPLVIRVPQPHGGVKIVLYDMLIEIRLS